MTTLFVSGCKKDEKPSESTSIVQLSRVRIGTEILSSTSVTENIAIDKGIVIEWNNVLDTSTIAKSIGLKDQDSSLIPYTFSMMDNNKTVVVAPVASLIHAHTYNLHIYNTLQGINGERFPGIAFTFKTVPGILMLDSLLINGKNSATAIRMVDIDRSKPNIELYFNEALNTTNYQSYISILNVNDLIFNISGKNKKVTITTNSALKGYTKYSLVVSSGLKSDNGFAFKGLSQDFYTSADTTLKFPHITDEALLTLVQQQTFKYFYNNAHPLSGMARERNTSGDVVTTGGSGFGVMALIVAMERSFISRADGLKHLDKILTFLEKADRFHGAWPHWLNGNTGKVVPFSSDDDGADLVETSFMAQGLIAMRQYLNASDANENALKQRITALCNAIEYDWFTQGQKVLYWHWSPNKAWKMNMRLEGYNETLITYVMAASSATHTIAADAYRLGYARNGGIKNGASYFGIRLPLGNGYGGPLFFTHYSFLGLDPRKLTDAYANYWEQNVNQSLINWTYCKNNPLQFAGYSATSWGLTASDNPWGYEAHAPDNDKGVITPTAALSAMPYTPKQSMQALRYFYDVLGDKLWGSNGFYDAFDVTENWWSNQYLAIDQGPIICMIENYRTGLLWKLFMDDADVQAGLTKLGFSY